MNIICSVCGKDVWKCDVCHRWRCDSNIAVKTLLGRQCKVNVKHCADNDDCISRAENVGKGWLSAFDGDDNTEHL